jgi:DNA transposition AAA+ family ATPase
MTEAQQRTQGGTCLTPTCQEIHDLLTGCQQFGLVGAVVGDSGTGKTTAVKQYARTQNEQAQASYSVGASLRPVRKVVYFEVRKAAASMRHFLVQLYQGLGGLPSRDSGNAELYDRIADELLRLKHREGLFIIDETQDLEQEAKDVIRNLYEDTEIGICLVGNKDLFAQKATRGTGKAQSVNRFLGRIGPRIILDKPLPDDIEALCEFYRITGKEAKKLVTRTATTGQQLHNLKNLLKIAGALVGDTETLSLEALKKAALLTGISS